MPRRSSVLAARGKDAVDARWASRGGQCELIRRMIFSAAAIAFEIATS
jgi:hypothetical protein